MNRRVSQTVNNVCTRYIYDGWNLIGEYNYGSTAAAYSYVYGTDGVVERLSGSSKIYYYHDALGSVAYTSDGNGNEIEYYRYDRFGQVTVYAPSGAVQPNGSSQDIRHLYAGQLWVPDANVYDMRNRIYSPTSSASSSPILSGSPVIRRICIGCSNNATTLSDPLGDFAYVSVNGTGKNTTFTFSIPIDYKGVNPAINGARVNAAISALGLEYSSDGNVTILAYTAAPGEPANEVRFLPLIADEANEFPGKPGFNSVDFYVYNGQKDSDFTTQARGVGAGFLGGRTFEQIWPVYQSLAGEEDYYRSLSGQNLTMGWISGTLRSASTEHTAAGTVLTAEHPGFPGSAIPGFDTSFTQLVWNYGDTGAFSINIGEGALDADMAEFLSEPPQK